MSDERTCREVRDLVAELSLGVLTGEERARALGHVGECAACRRHLADLREVADGLLLLGPPREPSVGFESRVLERLESMQARRGRRRWRRVLGVAAAVALAAAGSAAGLYLATAEDRELADHYRRALEQADGRYFGGIPLHAEHLARVGTVFGYEGSPAWMVIVVETPEEGAEGSYEVQIVTKDRERLALGSLELSDGRGSWGRTIPVSLQDVARVRLVDEEGRSQFEAVPPPP